jgi:hypothetical protein
LMVRYCIANDNQLGGSRFGHHLSVQPLAEQQPAVL